MPNFFWEIDIQFNNFSRITNNKNFNFWKTVEIRFLMKLSFLRQLNVCKCVQIQINLNKNKRKVVFQRTALWHPRLPAERWQNPLHQHFALATNLYGPDTDHWERERVQAPYTLYGINSTEPKPTPVRGSGDQRHRRWRFPSMIFFSPSWHMQDERRGFCFIFCLRFRNSFQGGMGQRVKMKGLVGWDELFQSYNADGHLIDIYVDEENVGSWQRE